MFPILRESLSVVNPGDFPVYWTNVAVSDNPRHTFTSYAAYLKRRYGERTYRVSVDAGFSCPNRYGGRNSPGCSFCEASGARAPYLCDAGDLQAQVAASLGFLRKRYGATRFLLYFQAYSGTNAPVQDLRRIYDAGLGAGPFEGLIVSTRPDCLDEEKADLLASYMEPDFDVWVELGLQSPHERTLEHINRGHTVSDFLRAFSLLRSRGIRIAVHLVFGLPEEGMDEIIRTARFVSRLHPEGVKIHNLHIQYSAPLYGEFMAGELPVLSAFRHREYVISFLERIQPDTVIMRLTCDTPADRRAAPRNFPDKAAFYSSVEAEMLRRGTFQGRLHEPDEAP